MSNFLKDFGSTGVTKAISPCWTVLAEQIEPTLLCKRVNKNG